MTDQPPGERQDSSAALAVLLPPKESRWWAAARLFLYMLLVWLPWNLLRWNVGLKPGVLPDLAILMIYLALEHFLQLRRGRTEDWVLKAAGLYQPPKPYRGPRVVWPLAVALPCAWSWWVASELGELDVFVVIAVAGWTVCAITACVAARVVSGRFKIGDDQAGLIALCVLLAQTVAVITTKPVSLQMEQSISRAIADSKMIGTRQHQGVISPPP